MKFKIRFAEQIVGFFLLAAIVGIAVILIFIGINQRWFAKNYSFMSRFESGGGLSVGMPITLKGFEIGKIARITLNIENEVDVQFSVQDTYYEKVLAGSVLQLTSSPIGLGTSLQFLPGNTPGPPQKEMSFIPSLDSDEGRALVAEGKVDIPKGEDVIGMVISKVNPILDEVRTTIAQIRHLADSVNSALGGKGGPVGEMVTGLSATPEKVNRTIDDVNLRVNTLLDKLSVIADTLDEISVNTRGAIGNLSTSLDQIAGDARGAIGNLSTSLDQIAGDTRGAIGNLSTSLDQITGDARGIIGNLSTSLDEISQNLKTMTEDLANTRGLATRLLDPKGSIGTFLDDQNALYAQVDSALKSANEIITQIRGFVEFVNGTRPQISSILEKGRDTLDQGKDVLEAVKNNPLLKGGVPPQTPQPATLKSYRDEDF